MNECDCLSAKFNRSDSFNASIVSYKAVSAALEKADETTAIICKVNSQQIFIESSDYGVTWKEYSSAVKYIVQIAMNR